MTEAVTTFVTFYMPSEAVERFKAAWLEDAAFIARQPGQKGGTIYRRIVDDEHVEFVNVAHWENQDSLNAARAAALVEQHRGGQDQASISGDQVFRSMSLIIGLTFPIDGDRVRAARRCCRYRRSDDPEVDVQRGTSTSRHWPFVHIVPVAAIVRRAGPAEELGLIQSRSSALGLADADS